MAAETQPTLFDRLRESGLLEQATLNELAQLREAKDPNPRALGKVLFTRKLLSKWQINLLAQGRGKELRLGKYVLLDKLGEGGMGQVLKARHLTMGRVVALKVIRKDRLVKSTAVERFFKEVRAAATLNHPNIAIAYDADESEGTHYFAMEFIDGTDLARLVRVGGPLPGPLACEYIRQAALGLQHAHEKGLVHRDIKPHNLMLTTGPGGKPVVKLLDMGLARLAQQGETGITQAGHMLGTPDYVAPEQAFDSHKADARSDVYSLGCTLYCLLTGSVPFTGDTLMQVLLKHQKMEALPLSQRRPDLPPALSAVVAKMMAKDPADRYQSAAEVADALEPLSKGEAGVTPVPPLPTRLVKTESTDAWGDLEGDGDSVIKVSRSVTRADDGVGKTSRSATRAEDDAPRRDARDEAAGPNKALLIGAGVGVPVVGLLVLGLAFLMWPAGKPAGGSGKVVETKDRKDKDDKPEPKDGPKDGDKEQPKDGGVRPVVVVGGDPKPSGRATPVVVHRSKAIGPLAPSHDGLTVVAFPTGRIVRLTSREEGAAGTPFPDSSNVEHAAYGPDGNVVVAVRSGEVFDPKYKLKLVDPTGGKVIREFDDVPHQVTHLHVSRDGRTAAVITRRVEKTGATSARLVDYVIRVYDVATGKAGPVLDPKESTTRAFQFTPDGKRIVSLGTDFIREWNVADGKPIRAGKPPLRLRDSLAITPDGQRAVILCSPAKVLVWDLNKEEQVRTIDLGDVTAYQIAPVSDGRHAILRLQNKKAAGAEPNPRVVLCDLETGQIVREFSQGSTAVKLAVSADARRLFTSDPFGTISVWDVEAPKPPDTPAPGPKSLSRHPMPIFGPIVASADGRK